MVDIKRDQLSTIIRFVNIFGQLAAVSQKNHCITKRRETDSEHDPRDRRWMGCPMSIMISRPIIYRPRDVTRNLPDGLSLLGGLPYNPQKWVIQPEAHPHKTLVQAAWGTSSHPSHYAKQACDPHSGLCSRRSSFHGSQPGCCMPAGAQA
jgi:hypothetical protein